MTRIDSRTNDELRATRITPNFQEFAEGSVLIETGLTKVICAASIEEKVPAFLRGQGKGWVTAEYGMLPRSTLSRTSRERSSSSGRTHEIQRLIGRSLRAISELDKMGERTINIDCDVLQADGGTRTASITGAYIALYQAMLGLVRRNVLHRVPLIGSVAATSVGLVDEQPMLDLCYEEDFKAAVDLNVVMTNAGEFVEVQGTGEDHPFSKEAFQEMLDLAEAGIAELTTIQDEAIRQIMST